MTLETNPSTRKRSVRKPKIAIDAEHLERIEGLAEGAIMRNPAMSNRLMDEIGRARVVASDKMPKTVISIGSTVTYRDEATGHERAVVLVFPEDADIARQRISLMTPIGVTLLGLSEGDAFYWDTRDNQRRMLTVVKVEQREDFADIAS